MIETCEPDGIELQADTADVIAAARIQSDFPRLAPA